MILHDTPRPVAFRRFRRSSHLMSDLLGPEGTAELDAFARRIGLRAGWRQNSGTPTAAGSTEVSPRDIVERVVRPKRAAP